jgi:hypothetical protein
MPNLEDYAESIIPSVWWHVKFLYLSYDGRYFTSFLFAAVNPLKIESYFLYKCIPIALMMGLFYAFYQLFKTFITNSRQFAIAYSCILFILFLSRNPNVPYTFYYMISSYVYLVPSIFFLLFISLSFQLITSKNQELSLLLYIVFCVFAFSGGNELLLIPGLVWFSILVFINNYFKHQKGKVLFLVFFNILCAYFIVFTSPGTNDFLAANPEEINFIYLIQALQKSILFSSSIFITWIKGNYNLIFMLAAFMALMKTDKGIKSIELPFKAIFLIACFMVISFSLLIFPYTWAASTNASTTYTQVYIVPYLFFVLYLAIFIYLLLNKVAFSLDKNRKLIFTLLIIGALSSSILDKDAPIRTAYDDIISMDAYFYRQEIEENIRNSKLHSSTSVQGNSLELCTLKHRPKSLYSGVYFNTKTEDFHLQYRLYYDIKKLKIVPCP